MFRLVLILSTPFSVYLHICKLASVTCRSDLNNASMSGVHQVRDQTGSHPEKCLSSHIQLMGRWSLSSHFLEIWGFLGLS